MNEKSFTFDVEKIDNGFIIFYEDKKIYREYSSRVNEYIEAELKAGMIAHVIDNYPQGTAQRLVVTISVTGKVME